MQTVALGLQPKQIQAFNSKATEILYGGAAGGGKSHLMRVASIAWAMEIPGLQIYLFRRIFDDLVKNHVEGPTGYRNLLHPWVERGKVEIIETEIRFWNGSKIHLCHCQQEKHRFKYQGAEIHVLLIDELTLFTDKIYRFLRNRVRMTNIKLPKKYEGRFPRILCGSNPGNVGHLFVKKTFIDGQEPLRIYRTAPSEGGMMRQYIPARLDDNKELLKADPNYMDRLSGLGSDALVKAMRDGDWNVIDGAFFDRWDEDTHVIKPFRIPAEWTRFRAMDWGYAKPFSVGWYAIADGRYGAFPRGALIRYREWYGIKTDEHGKFEDDKGVRLDVEEVRDGILARSKGEQFAYTVCDPAMWGSQSGPPPAETLYNEGGKGIKSLKKANNARVGTGQNPSGGWDQMRARLNGQMCSDGQKRPMLYLFQNNIHAIRTIPALIHDEDRPEDLNTDMEDHCADEVRYACMSRPIIIKRPQDKPRAPRAGHVESGTMIAPPLGTPEGWQAPQKDLDR
nr:terminase family protein [Thalassobius sp. Cn5-15]